MTQTDEYLLKVSNLNVKLQNQAILNNISFNVKKGSTIAILGPNGAGKSVLLRTLLNRLPYTGKVEWTEKTRIGYVPQNVSVADVPMTVKEFLSFGKDVDLAESLRLVRITDEGILNKRLGVISGGQLRRILIAWALNDKPNVLFLDEPTSGVDMDSEEPIYLMIDELKKAKEMTVFLITHDIHIVQEYTDSLLAINKCLTFLGPSSEISKPETQKLIYGEPVCVETIKGEKKTS
ncbi:MAG: metal ABC transporter ATP-binding protein [Candidatus Bathyarchaeia archaeon]|jgi:zinc transport system ATP-binding protein